MARKVKCTICKAEGTNDVFISVPKPVKGNYYFCSNEHVLEYDYLELEKRKAKWILDTIAKLINYDETKLFPNSIRKELNKLRTMYTYDVIYKCLEEGKTTIKWKADNGGWSTEWGMVRYIFSIIESKLNDTNSQVNRSEVLEAKVEEQAVKMQSIANIDDIDMSNKSKKKKTSIAMFLDDDDL